ncbi:TniQ protein [Paraburkholderia sp. RAU2J]|uniref:TniQ family protein n=1 Tax=Paraburkholderia sp. RAU2J TaxID=1938810 RepID=UPI000EB5D037|nr:TniQ family protein [Paraburkholderia sp. RAU2J]RKT25621.1 TniQ protein [Paraburkholderia sp. RAU2J]
MTKLLVRFAPMPDESTTGYLLRLSECNGFSSLLDLDLLASDEHGVDGLARVGSMLPGLSLQPLRGQVSHFRHLNTADPGRLSAKYWNGRRPRYCLECLAERPGWRAAWDLTLMVACPIHRARLRDSCPGCKQPLSWKRRFVSLCNCGRSLTEAASETATDAEIAVGAYLSSALTGEAFGEPALHRTNVGLLGLQDLLAACMFLGGYASNNAAKPTKIANLDEVSVATATADAAGRAFLDWPRGYQELLRMVCRNRGADNSCARLTARFGYFYTALYKRFAADQFDFLRREFDSYVSREWVGQLAQRNRRLSQATRRQHAWIPLTSAAKLLRTKRDTILVLIADGTLEGQTHKTAAGRTSGTVSRCSVEAFRHEKAQWMTLADARETLQISRKRAYALLRSHVLRPVGGPSVDGSAVWRFSAREVMALMSTRSDATSTADRH